MLNLKSFESFVNELKHHKRLNENENPNVVIETQLDLYDKIARKISGKKCLVINNYIMAMDLEKDTTNDVYCLYYDDDPSIIKDLSKNKKYQFVNLKNLKNAKKQITNIFDNVWELGKDFKFDYIINISPKITPNLQYKSIANLNAFICCYPFMAIDGKKSTKEERENKVIIFRKGYSIYYSFDENHAMHEFDHIIYDIRDLNAQNVRRLENEEWEKFGYNDKTARYFVVVFVEPNEDKETGVINNRNNESINSNDKDINLDEQDNSADVEIGRDDEHPFTGMSEPKIYAFKSPLVNSILEKRSEGDSIKVGDTNRTVAKRISEWKRKLNDFKIVRLKSWDAVLDGCGEGIDGKVFRDYTIHKLLETEVNNKYHNEPGDKKITHVNISEFPQEYRDNNRCSNEFFRNCTTDDVEHAIEILKQKCKEHRSDFLYNLNDNTESKNDDDVILPLPDDKREQGKFVDRDIQKETIDKFDKAFKAGKKKMLMYAVMRFGKTYVACRCAQKIPNNKFTVIVTAKPAVRNEWTETVNLHAEFAGYDMYDSGTSSKGSIQEMLEKWGESKGIDKDVVTLNDYFANPENKDRHVMLFMSLHDLFGDKESYELSNEVKQKHLCFKDYPVDLLIIDECHYGTQTGNFGHMIGETNNPQLNAVMKSLNLDKAIKLYLSGTPYNLILDEAKFSPDEMISKVGFADIIDAKKRWDDKYRTYIQNHLEVNIPGDPNDGHKLEWEDNPYFGTPELLEFGYNLSDFNLENYQDGYTVNFEDLFKCHKETEGEKKGHYVFNNYDDVKGIFEIIDGSRKETGVATFLDVEEVRKGNMCKHMVIVLPNINCCDALEDLLLDNQDDFKNLNEYRIIKASSALKKNLKTEKVKRLINKNEEIGNKTLTLTCDRLLTGVTIKPWDTMFFMKECSSSQEYDQAKFRIMTPYVKKVRSVDVGEDGNPIIGRETKVNMKPQVLFVDLHPDRNVIARRDRYQVELAVGDKVERDSRGDKIEDVDEVFDKLVEKEKGSITLLLLKDGKFVAGTSKDIGRIAMDAAERNATAMSIDDVFDTLDKKLSDPSLDEMRFMMKYGVKRSTTKGKVPEEVSVKPFGDGEETTPPAGLVPGSGTPPSTPSTPSSGSGKKTRTIDEERLIQFKQCRKTIIKDILMYLLLMNHETRVSETSKGNSIHTFARLYDSFNHYTGFDRKNFQDTPLSKIPKIMIENDKIICSIFCEGTKISEPNYDDPYDVSKTVVEIKEFIEDWAKTLSPNDRILIRESWRNVQIKYKKLKTDTGSNFESLRGVLSRYTRLGSTEIITPPNITPKMLENLVIFNGKDNLKILDLYCGKIGEIFNEIVKNIKSKGKFSDKAKQMLADSYYLICRTKTIAELNFFAIKKFLPGSNRKKREWFNSHVLVYDFTPAEISAMTGEIEKAEETEPVEERLETFVEFMKKLNEGKVKSKTTGVGVESLKKFEETIKDKFKINMWDCIIGNPPYNKDNVQLYPLFYLWGRKHCNMMSMIFPSAWQEPKKQNGLGLMNKPEIKHDKQIVYIDNIVDGFKGVSGAKNTNIVYWKKGYNNGLEGKQLVYTDGKNPQEIKFAIFKKDKERLPEITKLVECLGEFESMDTITLYNPYNIRTDFFKDPTKYKCSDVLKDEKENEDDIKIIGLHKVKYVNKENTLPTPKKNCHRDFWKILMSKTWGNFGGKYLGGSYSEIYIIPPMDICTENYVESGYCKSFEEAKKYAKYCMSKFARALLLNNKFGFDNNSSVWKSVPIQDFKEDWWNSDNIDDIDNGLFDKYNVPEDIRKFVRKNIQPKTTADILGYDGKDIDFSKVKEEEVEPEEKSYLDRMKETYSNPSKKIQKRREELEAEFAHAKEWGQTEYEDFWEWLAYEKFPEQD